MTRRMAGVLLLPAYLVAGVFAAWFIPRPWDTLALAAVFLPLCLTLVWLDRRGEL